MTHFRAALATAAVFALSGCADVPTDPADLASYEAANDPAEPTNRAIFSVNNFLDHELAQPVARAYADTMPDAVQSSIHNFASNLGEPATLINDVFQGNLTRAWTTTRRFAVNTTVGVAGFLDPATNWGLPGHRADFGETLGVWGGGTGPSVQLPLFAFSNVRDTVGLAVGAVMDPFNYIPGAPMTDIRLAGGGLGFVDRRAELLPTTDDIERTSLDYYAALRSVTASRRAKMIEEARAGKVEARKSGEPGKSDDLYLSP